MAAIEYGSYYWCVVLNGKEPNTPGESVHLHADTVAVDPTGTLLFKSAGRRQAGTEPIQQSEKENKDDKKAAYEKDEKNEKDGDKGKSENTDKECGMIYMAFAPGTWRVFYAAKLKDGAPASVEHWNATNGNPKIESVVPANAGAAGYPPNR
jgi:hypothetical protein